MPILGLPRKRGFVLLACIAVIAILALWLVPPLFVDIVDAKRTELANDARRTGAQVLGLILLGAGAYFTGRTVQVTREGQNTERFSKAIDHLGSDSCAVRTGGVYALERIASTSRLERGAVEDVLTAFVRQEAPRRTRAERDPDAPDDVFQPAVVPEFGQHHENSDAVEPSWDHHSPAIRVDVAGALAVLARLDPARSMEPRLDLRHADLREAFLAKARLPYTSVGMTDFRNAFLTDADFTECVFEMTDLREIVASSAKFDRARFCKCKLQGANLRWASFRDARFQLCDLRNADLAGVKLHGACYDSSTQWPTAFDPLAHGATTPCPETAQ